MRTLMNPTVMVLAAAVMGIAVTTPAGADERNAYRAISAGDMAVAERNLVAERRIFPQRPELMLNLAAVYARTDRTSEASALYDAALAAPAVELDLANGTTASSHDVARAGQRALTNAQVAAR